MSRIPPILLLTRPEAASRQFLADLTTAETPSFTPVLSPLMSIEALGPLPEVPKSSGVIFSSANAVRCWQALGGGVRSPCYTVGRATARAARTAGFDPISADGDADALVSVILGQNPGVPLFHLRGTHTRGNVAGRLRDGGCDVSVAVIYDQPAHELSDEARAALNGTVPVVVPLFSPRSAAQFARTPPGGAPLFVAAMSADVSDALRGIYLTRLDILPRPEGRAMLAAVKEMLQAAGTLEVDRGSVKG
ncbi:uroporphyrinogen-III synthase [Salipiger sp.]|uniref:uroporphyrinogen-III synthase n=1 Tax=Salipiger sp. TaxID=2078585 RepID=UPI003A97A2E0